MSWNQPEGSPWGEPSEPSPYGYPPPASPPGYGRPLLAGWWRRVGATLLDAIIIGIPVSVVLLVAGIGSPGNTFINGLVLFIYQTLMLSSVRAQTLGNMAVGTRVVDANMGGAIGGGRAAGRSVVSLLLSLTLIGGILDALWPLWDARNQTLHDKAANTLVVYVNS